MNRFLAHPRALGRKARAKGISLIEAMLGLSVLAFVIIAGVTAFNAVSERAQVNNLLAGLQEVIVDVSQYLSYHHVDAPDGLTEATAAASTALTKALGATGSAAQTVAAAAACSTHNGAAAACGAAAGCSCSGVACATCSGTGTNTLMTRFTSMPSVQYGDGDGAVVLVPDDAESVKGVTTTTVMVDGEFRTSLVGRDGFLTSTVAMDPDVTAPHKAKTAAQLMQFSAAVRHGSELAVDVFWVESARTRTFHFDLDGYQDALEAQCPLLTRVRGGYGVANAAHPQRPNEGIACPPVEPRRNAAI